MDDFTSEREARLRALRVGEAARRTGAPERLIDEIIKGFVTAVELNGELSYPIGLTAPMWVLDHKSSIRGANIKVYTVATYIVEPNVLIMFEQDNAKNEAHEDFHAADFARVTEVLDCRLSEAFAPDQKFSSEEEITATWEFWGSLALTIYNHSSNNFDHHEYGANLGPRLTWAVASKFYNLRMCGGWVGE